MRTSSKERYDAKANTSLMSTHRGCETPLIGPWIVDLNRTEIGHAVVATNSQQPARIGG